MTARALVLAAALSACALRGQPSRDPHLDQVRPDSVRLASGVITEVVLVGRGFEPGAPGRNTVLLGTHAVNDVPANADGTEIRFVIPDIVASGGEAPPAPLDAGSYAVRVRTRSGESNAATVRILR